MLDELTAARIDLLSRRHGIAPRWNEPWKKSRTAGSDDHGLLNVGRTWTQFPDDANTTEKILACLRTGQCSPGGEAGSSAKLAHTFYSVAVRYYDRHILEGRTPNVTAQLLQMLVGARPEPTRAQKPGWLRNTSPKTLASRRAPFAPTKEREGTGLLKRLFLASARQHANDHPHLYDTLRAGLPPLGEQEAMFDFVSSINRDITTGIAAAINQSIDDASFTDLFDSIAAILAQQFILLPYYFAVFHQNKERHLLAEITGRKGASIAPMKIGLFTDTFDEVNGVARFVRNIGACAESSGHSLIVHTCCENSKFKIQNSKLETPSWRKNFAPLLSREFPYYSELRLSLPPLLEILEWADRQQFDAIHVSTPGPMGLAGWIVSKMLRVPLVMTHHTDFPAYARHLTGDHRIADGTATYLKWFFDQAAGVFSRSNAYHTDLIDFGVAAEKLNTIPPGIDTHRFHLRHRDESIWKKLNITQRHKLLYVGRVSKEKNLPFLVEIFQQLCADRTDTALIIAGDGPYRAEMQKHLANLPVYFIGYQNDAELAALYATSDVFIFPSRTDTLGQVVMEAAASGLPAIVTSDGGPRELIDDAETGYILPAQVQRWISTIASLLDDDRLRERLSRTAHERAARFDIVQSFESFWQRHRDLAFRGDAAANSEPLAEVRT